MSLGVSRKHCGVSGRLLLSTSRLNTCPSGRGGGVTEKAVVVAGVMGKAVVVVVVVVVVVGVAERAVGWWRWRWSSGVGVGHLPHG